MQRVTISIDDDLLAVVDDLMARRGYQNRSEAFRDIVRETAARAAPAADPKGSCVATLAYVFDHHRRDLSQRLTHAHHDHHDLAVATLHVHLDHDSCLEVAVLKGPFAAVRALGDQVTTERGVRFGALHVIPAKIDDHGHDHGPGGHTHGPQGHTHGSSAARGPRHTHIRV
jgi:CopG family transcriptional regulator, nickel-responsive regulator